jgi:hypothetical protein
VAVVAEQLVNRQNQLAQAQGNIALGLIQVYRSLGGGWQIRCDPQNAPEGPTSASLEPLGAPAAAVSQAAASPETPDPVSDSVEK